MSRPYPLQTVLDLSQLRLDNASRMLAELLAREMEASERSQLLVRYREEYEARFLAAARTGIGREAFSNYRGFLAQLDQALVQAQQAAAASRERTAAGQQAWLRQRSRVQAFDTLAQRHHSRELRQEARREQKAVDEQSARAPDGLAGDRRE